MQKTHPATAGRGHTIREMVVAVMVAPPARLAAWVAMSKPFNTPTLDLRHMESNQES
jgi:choline-glycine betaine transporter